MIGASFVALATAWSVVAVDTIAESARTDGRAIVTFGTTLAHPGSPGGIWILIGIVGVGCSLWAMAFAILHGRRLQRRVDAHLEEGWRRMRVPSVIPDLSDTRLAGDPRAAALHRRRDDLLLQLREVQRELDDARRLVGQSDWYGRIEDALIVLPEFDGEDELASRRTTRREPLEG